MKTEAGPQHSGIHGIVAYLITPFDQEDRVDVPRLAALVDQLIDDGVHALAPLGSAGLQSYLSEEERFLVLETVCERAAGRVPIVAGVSAVTMAGALRNARFAHQCGASALLAAPTSDWKLTPAETHLFYERLAGAVPLPIMVYDTSMKAGGLMPLDQLSKLADIQGITMVKDSSGDIERLQDLLLRTEGRLAVFAGKNTFAVPALMLGCHGWCSAAPIVAAAATVELYRAAVKQSDLHRAKQIGAQLQPLLQALVKHGLPRSVLAAMELIGRPAGFLRAPLLPVGQAERKEIADSLAHLNLLPL